MKIYFRKQFYLLVLIFTSVYSLSAVANSVFYVFIDKNGKTRIQDTLSVELAELGYRMVNASGVTFEVVPPKSEVIAAIQQKKQSKKQKNLQKLQRSIAEQNYAHDKALIQTFSSVNDIMAARDRKIDAVQGIITVTLANIASFEVVLDKMKGRVERYLSKNQKVSEKLQRDIKTVMHQIKGGRDFIQRKRAKLQAVQLRADQDVTRFKALLAGAETQH